MEVQALTKYVRLSPKKLRQVTRVIQGRPAMEALDLLLIIPRKSARLVRKTLASAVANAENNHRLSSKDLVVKRALAEPGSMIKRMRAVSRGSGHPIHKHTSHIRIILSDNAATAADAE
jgi:large subunit ribosomal protein L22